MAGSGRPLARDRDAFQALFEERRPLYESADGTARDLDDAVLAAAGVRFAPHREARGDTLVADERVAELHGIEAAHSLPAGRVRQDHRGGRASLARATARAGLDARCGRRGLDDRRRGVRGRDVHARSRLGAGALDPGRAGGCGDRREDRDRSPRGEEPRRRIPLAQRDGRRHDAALDAARGRAVERALRGREVRAPRRRADLGARAVRAGPAVCGLQGGRLPARPVRARRAGTAQPRPHVRARARGCVGLLAVSRACRRARVARGTADLRSRGRGSRGRGILQPHAVAVDRDAAWAALLRDKKTEAGSPRLVLLEAPGKPRLGVEVEPARVNQMRVDSALDALIAYRVTAVRILVLNGVNLDVLGQRDPELYGGMGISELETAPLRVGARSSTARFAAARRTTRASSSTGATRRTSGWTG